MSFQIDPDSLSELYGEHAEAMLVYFTRRCYDGQLAIDLVAETFARAFARRSGFRGSAEEASGWLWAIARNVLTDALRRGRVERSVLRRLGVQVPRLEDDELELVERLADLPQLRATLLHALAALTDEQREAVRLKVILEMDYQAIANRLGVSQQVVRARVSRALRALRAELDAQGQT